MEGKEEKKGLIKRVEELENKEKEIELKKSKKKEKRFDLPFFTKAKAKNSYKKNNILILYLKRDRNIVVKWGSMNDGLVFFDGYKYHNANQKYVYFWKSRIPLIIIPEWSLNPIGNEEDCKEEEKVDAQHIGIRAFEAYKNQGSLNKISPKMWIWIGIGGIIVAYVLFGSN